MHYIVILLLTMLMISENEAIHTPILRTHIMNQIFCFFLLVVSIRKSESNVLEQVFVGKNPCIHSLRSVNSTVMTNSQITV